MNLSESLKVKNVLHLPNFKYNLQSVGQLLRQSHIAAYFYSRYYYLQDSTTNQVLAVGWYVDGLYRLNNMSFNKDVLQELTQIGAVSNITVDNCFTTIIREL